MAGVIRIVSITTGAQAAITASIVGNRIQLQEDQSNAGFPLSAFTVFRPTVNGSGHTVPAATGRFLAPGSQYDLFKGISIPQVFSPNEIVCYVQAATANFNLVVDESGC